jgi:hypothetical protein
VTDGESVPQAEIDEWIDSVRRMYYGEISDTDCWGPAGNAVADLMSGWGMINAPLEVLEMIRQALEVGYATALEHVRDGRVDDQIEMWRPLVPEA